MKSKWQITRDVLGIAIIVGITSLYSKEAAVFVCCFLLCSQWFAYHVRKRPAIDSFNALNSPAFLISLVILALGTLRFFLSWHAIWLHLGISGLALLVLGLCVYVLLRFVPRYRSTAHVDAETKPR